MKQEQLNDAGRRSQIRAQQLMYLRQAQKAEEAERRLLFHIQQEEIDRKLKEMRE